MPRKRAVKEAKDIQIDFGTVSEPQAQFLASKTMFTCYGGARGGGKTHVARLKAVGMCLEYPGIRILMVRAHYPELTANLIDPILSWLPAEIYSYNNTDHKLTIYTSRMFEGCTLDSTIKFGHYDSRAAENEYQGVQYDVIFLEEATQLSERAFQFIGSCLRGVNDFPKRMYLTCNPGGVGHKWVKDLFIDKKYRNDPKNPERNQNPEDYTFIKATVDDNPWLLEKSPTYLQQLANLPDDLRAAHRYGDWNALSGAYFSNFHRSTHTMSRFKIPYTWPLYRSFDYGLDMMAVIWWAVDEDGRCWAYREVDEKNLVVQQAASLITDNTLLMENISATYAPPDLWNRQKDTGKTMAEIFMQNGVGVIRADNNRVQGHMIMKDMMTAMPLNDPYVKSLFPKDRCPGSLPALMFFDDLEKVIEDIESIQADEKNPNDCAKDPHDVTHTVDACRYFLINRSRRAQKQEKKKRMRPLAFLEERDEDGADYEAYLCGGEITEEYMM